MFFSRNSSVLFYYDLVLVAGKIIITVLMLCARLIVQVTQIQSLLDVTLLLDCLNLWRMKVLWFRVQVWRDLPSSHVIPVCLLPVVVIVSGTWLRWKKMSSQMLQSPSCLVGYLNLTHILSPPALVLHSKNSPQMVWWESGPWGPCAGGVIQESTKPLWQFMQIEGLLSTCCPYQGWGCLHQWPCPPERSVG